MHLATAKFARFSELDEETPGPNGLLPVRKRRGGSVWDPPLVVFLMEIVPAQNRAAWATGQRSAR